MILIRSIIKKILSKDNQGKSANEMKKITSNLKDLTKFGSGFRKSTLRSSNCFFLNFSTPFRTKVMPVQNRDIFYGKKGDSLIFAPSVIEPTDAKSALALENAGKNCPDAWRHSKNRNSKFWKKKYILWYISVNEFKFTFIIFS